MPASLRSSTALPTAKACLKIFSLRPPSTGLHRDDAGVGLLEDARRGAHERRLHDAEVLDDLVDAAVDGRGEAAGQLRRQQHLAEGVGHRQPQELQVVLVEDPLHLDRLALVDPRLVQRAHALGAPGRARGVDQGRELVGGDRVRDGADDVGVLGEVGVAELAQLGQRDDALAVGGTVEGDDRAQRAELGLALGELGELLVVLGEDELAVGVTEDVGGVLGVGARVDRRGGATGTHHRQVGDDPLVARAGGDADPLLGLETERQQTGREPGDLVAGLASTSPTPTTRLGGSGRPRALGEVATRSRNRTATFCGRLSTKDVS